MKNNIIDESDKLKMDIEFSLIQTTEINSLKKENEQMDIRISDLQLVSRSIGEKEQRNWHK